jgi:hypothetical protein
MPGIVAAGAAVVVITAIHLTLDTRFPSIASYDGLTGRMSSAGLLELRMLA